MSINIFILTKLLNFKNFKTPGKLSGKTIISTFDLFIFNFFILFGKYDKILLHVIQIKTKSYITLTKANHSSSQISAQIITKYPKNK